MIIWSIIALPNTLEENMIMVVVLLITSMMALQVVTARAEEVEDVEQVVAQVVVNGTVDVDETTVVK
jgi:hypothetical protein